MARFYTIGDWVKLIGVDDCSAELNPFATGTPLCTRCKTEPRSLTLRPQVEYQALQAVRQPQQTVAWQARYNRRAGVEGTLSQGVNTFGL